ncbi:uncharacterized protein LOC116252586 [Nymphaea colorata]|nr:uncharacterized protein LOC116252586 [Nymphaea colorata]
MAHSMADATVLAWCSARATLARIAAGSASIIPPNESSDTLSYSNTNFFGLLNSDDYGTWYWTNGKVTDTTAFNAKLGSLLKDLTSQSTTGPSRFMFAMGSIPYTDLQTINGLVQCTGDTSLTDCKQCLNSTRSKIPTTCKDAHGCEIATGSCRVSFEESRCDGWSNTRLGYCQSATDDFALKNKLREGGSGPTTLPDGQETAVKRLSRNTGHGPKQFDNEVLTLTKLQHRNLVRLLGGFMEAEEKILVYEYVQNTSLDNFPFGEPMKHMQLDWPVRFKLINGIARGILYLHEDSRLRIVHRDLKASNVLLDEDTNPKTSDFGTAKIFDTNQTQAKTFELWGLGKLVTGYHIPNGVRLLVNVWATSRDPSIWTNPLEFQPERFMSGSKYEHIDVKGTDLKLYHSEQAKEFALA